MNIKLHVAIQPKGTGRPRDEFATPDDVLLEDRRGVMFVPPNGDPVLIPWAACMYIQGLAGMSPGVQSQPSSPDGSKRTPKAAASRSKPD